MKLQDAVVIITGGASGLGQATANRFANQGAKVAVLDLHENPDHYSQVCDITDADATEAAVSAVTNNLGPIRVLVNCAGVAPGKRIVGRDGAMPLDNFASVININLIGSFNTMRLCATQMSLAEPITDDGERGVIINTASVAATDGQIGQAAYSASKAGVAGMTLPAARELAQFGIRVVTIAPGIFATPMMTAMPEAVQDALGASIPFPKRMGTPDEFAHMAQHITENSVLNGCTIRLDGAIRMQAK